MAEEKSEWKNVSGKTKSVVVLDRDGKETGGVLRHDETVWLSERERIATANAPRRAEDNPFTNGDFILVTASTEILNRRPIGEDTPEAVAGSPEPAPESTPEPVGPRVEREATEPTVESEAESAPEAAEEEVGATPIPPQPVATTAREAATSSDDSADVRPPEAAPVAPQSGA